MALLKAMQSQGGEASSADLFVRRGVKPEQQARAKELKQAGATPEAIWKETGLWEYQPEVWVRETDDRSTTVASARSEKEGALGDFVSRSDDLLALYPELANANMRLKDVQNASEFDAYTNPSKRQMQSHWYPAWQQPTVLHEMQHVTGAIDGLPSGSNELDPNYERSAGEVLANLSEDRMFLTPAERRATPPMHNPEHANPYYAEAIPAGQQVIKKPTPWGPPDPMPWEVTPDGGQRFADMYAPKGGLLGSAKRKRGEN